MRKFIIAAIGLVGILTGTAIAPTVAGAAGSTSAHKAYIKAIEHHAPGLKDYETSYLNKFGNLICNALYDGNSVQTTWTTMATTKSALNMKQKATILSGAVIYLCPGFVPALKAYESDSNSSSVA